MGLSPDPEKRARQLRNLRRGFPTVAARHGLEPDEPSPPAADPPPAPARDAAPAGVSVLDYNESDEHEPETVEAAGEPAGAPPDPKPEPEPEPGPDELEPEPDAGLWGRFRDGFLAG